jgi:hypothetical protein
MSALPKADHPAETVLDDVESVAHQALRREVNEEISHVNHHFQVSEPEDMEVLCECVRTNCTGRIRMAVADYEAVRRFPTRFFVKEGHEVLEGERVVDEASGYVVVEKSGPAGLYAVGSDPRRRPLRSVKGGT